jgi:hypothetical protein
VSDRPEWLRQCSQIYRDRRGDRVSKDPIGKAKKTIFGMKEDDGRVVRRSSGHSSNEPAIQVICLVSDVLCLLESKIANIIRALEADQAKTMSQASLYGQQQRIGPRTPS